MVVKEQTTQWTCLLREGAALETLYWMIKDGVVPRLYLQIAQFGFRSVYLTILSNVMKFWINALSSVQWQSNM